MVFSWLDRFLLPRFLLRPVLILTKMNEKSEPAVNHDFDCVRAELSKQEVGSSIFMGNRNENRKFLDGRKPH
jgi:hypothetical protein